MPNKLWLYNQIPEKNREPISSYRFYSLVEDTHIYLINRWNKVTPEYIFFFNVVREFNHFLSEYCIQSKSNLYLTSYFGVSLYSETTVFRDEHNNGITPKPITNEYPYVTIFGTPVGVNYYGKDRDKLVLTKGDVKSSFKWDHNYEIHINKPTLPQPVKAGFGRYTISHSDMEALSTILEVDFVHNNTYYYKD